MGIEPFRIYISATHQGAYRNGKVYASYALRVLGNGINKVLKASGPQAEVQAMYAIGLNAAYNFLWSEIEDTGVNSKPAVEVVVRKPNMRIRFEQADDSLFERAIKGETKATDNIDVWLEDSVMATHFPTTFRKPLDEEKPILSEIEDLATAEASKRFLNGGTNGD
ncbi:hypothetical protein CO670_23835 [Rhizobium sp. J15]|uniref:hypothetical protein n=1 Tax=Rhizobium sp. J15 TaxID=2035450 RepID=UPI000BEA3D39|nr:hypothetical protein [Rhizobium sp. J15]PDT14321.1 hypothetical protein CO670_23835 [Rhizobium sp. J15]